MSLTDEENELLTDMLRDLESELKNMTPSSKQFVQDQIERHEKYGQEMRLSPKQRNWLNDLYHKLTGDTRCLN
jgi:hypothetical protein